MNVATLNIIDPNYWVKFWLKDYPENIDNKDRPDIPKDFDLNLRKKDYDYTKLFDEINKIVKFQKNDKILDVGCGDGTLDELIYPHVAKIAGIDYSRQLIDVAKKNRTKAKLSGRKYTLETMDAIDILYPKEKFDKAISIAVVQYMPSFYLLKYIQDMMFVVKDSVFIGEAIPVDKEFDESNVTQIPVEYWLENWSQYKPEIIEAETEKRYHVLLKKS